MLELGYDDLLAIVGAADVVVREYVRPPAAYGGGDQTLSRGQTARVSGLARFAAAHRT